MSNPVTLAVLGAGAIGKRHIEHIRAEPEARLLAVVDPAPAAKDTAAEAGAPWFPSLGALIARMRPDGVVVATPNQLHVANGLEAVAAGIPALIEKPIADDVAAGAQLVEAARAAGVPLLVGHHRRHNPMVRKAKEIIDSGRLGRVLALHGASWFFKPDDYFDTQWRREKGAGPVLVNLIHDVDLFRYLVGEVEWVSAQTSNATRGHAVEDTAVILLRFASGALATVTVSDTIVAPWNWELTTGENPAYPHTGEACYLIGGTHGSLTVPQLEVWSNRDKRSWLEPLERERVEFTSEDPLAVQIRHFCRVVRREEAPLVSGREGLATLRVIEAITASARHGQPVEVN